MSTHAVSKLDPWLRFKDAGIEREFQARYLRDNLGYIRVALVLAVVAWTFFGLVLPPDRSRDLFLLVHVSGVLVAAVCLGLSFMLGFRRWWQAAIVCLVVVSSALSEMHRTVVGHPAEWTGVISLMMVLAFAYALLRLQYRYAAVAGLLAIVCYNLTRVVVQAPGDIGLAEPDVDLIAFATIGTAAAFALDRFARLLFLRERDLDRERERADGLLLNVMPGSIVDRLKLRDPGTEDGPIAERHAGATVLFADLVGFTERAAVLDPDQVIQTLDDVFIRWDVLADRFGLEKIKTIGDAYMAVAGVPDERSDHVEVAADMALAVRDSVSNLRWPGGTPIELRIGLASGPLVAGVIGHRKFAYDVWGDTVNAASRLEATAAPGSIQVSDAVYDRLGTSHVFSEPYVVDLKGKGPTIARSLLGQAPLTAAVL